MHEARVELHRILAARELSDAILLVFANKQDLAHSMSTEEVRERLQLERFGNRLWTVKASCATSGEGLVDGLSWLAENIKNPPKLTAKVTTDSPAIRSPRQASPSPRSPANATGANAMNVGSFRDENVPREGSPVAATGLAGSPVFSVTASGNAHTDQVGSNADGAAALPYTPPPNTADEEEE
jgi:hypothetical protein